MQEVKNKNKNIRKAVLLAVVVLAAVVHFRCLFLGFNLFWDLIHVFRNPFQTTISVQLFGRAFTRIVEAEYTPIRLLTNSLDYTFWGYNPFGHHLSSFLFFLLAVLLVFAVAEELMFWAGCRFSQRISVAGLTALLFGVHPLKVEVVAWVTPREYLICSCFYLLSILTYAKWLRGHSGKWYALAVLCALGAGFSQAMSVSLPLVLILLDYYPFGRFKRESGRKVLVEKIPFIIVALLTAAKIVQIRRQVHILHPIGLPRLLRNLVEFPAVLLSYLVKTIFPVKLSPIYPIDLNSAPWLIVLFWVMLMGSIIFALIKKKESPAFLIGLFLSLIIILPQGGIVRSGATVLADRYVQLANLPLLFGLAWAAVRASQRPRLRWPVAILALIWITFLIWETLIYTPLWDKPVDLTRRAYDSYPRTRVIEIFMLRTYSLVGLDLINKGNFAKALECVQRALEINPYYEDIYLVWADILYKQGKVEEARRVYEKVLQIKPDFSNGYLNLGVLLAREGKLEEAEAELKKAIAYDENNMEAHYNLGLVYRDRGRWSDAVAELNKARSLGYREVSPRFQEPK